MTRFSARYALALGLLVAVALVPIGYSRLAPVRDECPSNAVLLDAGAIDPSIQILTGGRRGTKIEAGRLSGTLPPQSADQHPLVFAIQRTFGLPNRLLEPASALPGRREPDDVRFETLETDYGEIPVHYAYERRGRAVRVTAYIMAHRGKAIRSPLWTRLSNGPAALIDGRWPITLFAVAASTKPRMLEPNLARVDTWLNNAWSHYQRVCGDAQVSARGSSDSDPL